MVGKARLGLRCGLGKALWKWNVFTAAQDALRRLGAGCRMQHAHPNQIAVDFGANRFDGEFGAALLTVLPSNSSQILYFLPITLHEGSPDLSAVRTRMPSRSYAATRSIDVGRVSFTSIRSRGLDR